MNTAEYIKQAPVVSFRRGEVLVSGGDQMTRLFAVRSGFIKVVSISDTGLERIVWIAGRYDIAPVEQLFSRRAAAQFFYVAVTDGEYYAIDKAAFLDEASQSPQLMSDIARGMADHYDDVMNHLKAIEATSVRERILRLLSYLARRLSADDVVDLYEQGFRMTHQELATMVGASRETTSLELARLRREGLITYSRSQFIVSVDRIARLIG